MEKGGDLISLGKWKYSPWEGYYFTTLSISFKKKISLLCPLCGGRNACLEVWGGVLMLFPLGIQPAQRGWVSAPAGLSALVCGLAESAQFCVTVHYVFMPVPVLLPGFIHNKGNAFVLILTLYFLPQLILSLGRK